MEYIGVISHVKPAGDLSYVLQCSKGSKFWYIDALVGGSIARFVNHSCEPNSYMVALNDYSDTEQPHKLFLKSLVGIEKGSELTFRYSAKAFFFDCLCGSVRCRSRPAVFPQAVVLPTLPAPRKPVAKASPVVKAGGGMQPSRMTVCCCEACTQDVSRSAHMCSVSGQRCFEMCFSPGAPKGFGSRWPCKRCVDIVGTNAGLVLTLTEGRGQEKVSSSPRTLAVTSSPLAIVASCIEALAVTFNLEELNEIA